MRFSIKHVLKIISCVLIAAFVVGSIPWQELSADANTHGEYKSSPLEITYDQNSTWGNSTQGQYQVKNISQYTVTSWTLEIDYSGDVRISNIWNATDITNYDSDEKIFVSSNSTIEAGQTYTFGLIAEGKDQAPSAPKSVKTINYLSNEPVNTPTATPEPVVTDDVTPTTVQEVTSTATPTPTPKQEEETEVFPYAIFASSKSTDFTFNGWKSTIVGDIYTGKDFVYQGSELYMDGYVRTAGTLKTSGWKINMTGSEKYIDSLQIPDWSKEIKAKEKVLPSISKSTLTSKDKVVANGYYYANGDLNINGTDFTGDAVIVAKGNITYNVDSLNAESGRVLLYSENGNITINGTKIGINGILYAPKGKVSINANEATINGRIVANKFSYNGSILNVTADPSDLQLFSDFPDVKVTASKNKVNVGETAYYTIEIPKNNAFEILYRLNGTDVTVVLPADDKDPIRYDLETGVAGTYVLEAYVSLSYGEFVLDSDTIVVNQLPTNTPTATATPTSTPTSTPTNTPKPTNTPTSTPTSTPTNTPKPTNTPTSTPTSTPTNTPKPTNTPTSTPTSTPTNTPKPTNTPTSTPTSTPTNTPTVTSTPTSTPTATATPVPAKNYDIFSEGDVYACGYKNHFDNDHWYIGSTCWMTRDVLSLINNVGFMLGDPDYVRYNGSRDFSPDYSLNGRLTFSLTDSEGSGGGVVRFYIAPKGQQNDNNSIAIYIAAASQHIMLVDSGNTLSEVTVAGINEYGAYSDIWYEYDGKTHIFNVYIAKYDQSGNVTKPDKPQISYEIDFSERFSGIDGFTFGFAGKNGWSVGTTQIRGVEIDPNPYIHSNTPTPTITPVITPVQTKFTSISQGNAEYGYKKPFDEDTWKFQGDSKYASKDKLLLLDSKNELHSGDAFISFAENVGKDYEFYTRFSFTQKNVFSNGLAFVIEPYNNGNDIGLYGRNGYNLHDKSVVIEFDFDPQSNYYVLQEDQQVAYNESNSHVGIIVDGKEQIHSAVADYKWMRELGLRTDCWVDYDGKTLSVYVCTINKYGHIYKYETPILSIDIDLKAHFNGDTNLRFGFVSGDFRKASDVELNGFEIAKTPFTTPLPQDLPVETQDGSQIVSMGAAKYGYKERFVAKEWTGRGVNSDYIVASAGFGDRQEMAYEYPCVLSDDYSFSGRITMRYNQSLDPGDYINFVLSSDRDGRAHSVAIHMDITRSDSSSWRNEFGEPAEGQPDGFYSGKEPYDGMLAVCLNWKDTRDYAQTEYTPFLVSGATHDVWFNYDGKEKKLYVYVATYDKDGNVTKPEDPSLVCPLDLEAVFKGSHTVYLQTVGINASWNNGDFELWGIEFDPRPDIHNEFNGALQVLAPKDNKQYFIGDSIEISGRTGSLAAPDTDVSVVVKDADGKEIYSNTGDVADTFGCIDRISTDNMNPGDYTIVLTVTDKDGNDVVKEISITLKKKIFLAAELDGIELVDAGVAFKGSIDCNEESSYELQVLTVNENEEEVWKTFASGNGNKTNEVLGILSGKGLESGTYSIRLVVTSESGLKCERQTEIDYVAPEKTFTDEELFADIDDEFNGAEITFIKTINGTVKGTELKSYTFEAISVDTGKVVVSYTGTTAVEGTADAKGVLGQFDPTLLKNGYYKFVLTAYAEEGSVSDETVVLVTGQAKIGNYSMTFNDMTLPVAGLPVNVYRTYDSMQKDQLGDFGYGWTMSVGGPTIHVSSSLGKGWGYKRQTSLPGNAYWVPNSTHEIYIDWGNGSSEKFELVLTPEKWMDPPVGTVEAKLLNKTNNGDILTILDAHSGMTYDAVEGLILDDNYEVFAPKDFLLTRPDGTKYYFNLDQGLYKIEDNYGRIITIGANGIIYKDLDSSSKIVVFDRDSEGKINSISYGNMTVTYTYDDNGDLKKVTDIGGYKTSFVYDKHYVTEITDNDGHSVATNKYTNGRLTSTTDANNKTVEFEHDLKHRVEIVRDRLGNETKYEYDERGNVITITDANKHVTKYEYDDRNNKTKETMPDGKLIIEYDYDPQGNLISVKDNNNRIIKTDYKNGAVTKVTVMNKEELKLEYDDHGNPTAVTDAAGNTQNYSYDTKGNLTGVTDKIGTVMTMTYKNGQVDSIINADNQKTTFTYDGLGRLKTRTYTYDNKQRTDTYTYDNSNRVTEIRYADNTTVKYKYNQAGDVTSATDSQGRVTTYDYDFLGNLTKITYPDKTTETFEYNFEGWNTSATDRLGRKIRFSYDKVGNVTQKTYPNDTFEKYEYDACNRLVKATNVYGAVTEYKYDYLGRCIEIIDTNKNSVSYGYDNNGNVTSITDAKNNRYEFEYDYNGNQTKAKYPNGSIFEYEYDARGRLITEKDAYGHLTSYGYDGLDRLTSVTDAAGSTWNYTFDELGNVASVTDSKGNTTSYNYEFTDTGLVVTVTNALNHKATTKYDKHGRVSYTIDFGGTKTEYEYDEYDRVKKTTTNGEETNYTYDNKGNLIKVEDLSGTIKYDYNSMGFLILVTNAKGEKISYEYNDGYQLSKISIDNQDISYGYDKQGRLTSVTDSKGTTNYTYDVNGNRKSTKYPNGVITTYEYNDQNILTKQVSKDSSDVIIASYEYTIGLNGERLSCKELGRTVEYKYDELNRLIEEKVTVGTQVSVTSYTYDKNSNRLTMSKDGTLTTYAYNELNQITRAGDINYTWDNAGNLVSQTTTTGVLVGSYTYDSQNRMISANVSTSAAPVIETYEYDYLGNRTAKTSGGVRTEYTTDLSTGYSQVLKATTGSKSVYYTRGFELISRQEGSAASYYIYDGGLSVRALTNEAGTVTDTLVFDAFGNETTKTGSTDNSYGFQGEEKDETGLYYLRARYMDPATGTFTSMDTYGGSLSDPMSLHKYLFANSNPVMYSDPSGHFSLMEMDASMAIDYILNAGYMSGYLYIIDANITDPNLEHHNFMGYLGAIGAGMLFATMGLVLSATVTGLLILAIIDTLLGVAGTVKGVIDILNGHPLYGGIEIVGSAVLVWFGWRNYAGARSAANAAKATNNTSGKSNVNSGDNTNNGNAINSQNVGEDEQVSLYHYTNDKGLKGITESKKLNPSLKANNPNDARYGNGQYLSDIDPHTTTPTKLAKKFINVPNKYKYTSYVEIDVTGLNVVKGRDGVYVIPNEQPLDVSNRILGSGKVGGG